MAKLLIVTLSLLSLLGCDNSILQNNDNESKSIQNGLTPLNPDEGSVLDGSLGGLFQNKTSITPSSLGRGLSACAQLENQKTLEGRIRKWPSDLSNFGIFELQKFPDLQLLLDSVNGIFLVDGDMLSFEGADGDVAGLMCDNDRGQNFIFLNYDIFVIERMKDAPIGEWQDIKGIINQHIVTTHGDQFIFTLIHEIFHAIDHKSYLTSPDSTQSNKRDNLLSNTWDTPDKSKFDDDLGLSLNSNRWQKKHTCAGKAATSTPTLLLQSNSGSSGTNIADSYKSFYESTDFISFYASTNAYEDFADTLATWYFAKTYNNGLKRTVYKEDLSSGVISGATKLYEFDTLKTLAKSALHKSKVCSFVSLVFETTNCGL